MNSKLYNKRQMNEFIQREELYRLMVDNNILKIGELLKSGQYSVNMIMNNRGDSILHLAVLIRNIDLVKLLLENEMIHVNIGNDEGVTPLFMSTDLTITKLIIDAGGFVTQCDEKGNIPLHSVVLIGSPKLLDLHMKSGAHPLTFNEEHDTPILIACSLSSAKMIRQMVKKRSDLMFCNASGYNGFHLACKCNSIDVVKYLVKCIPDIDINEGDKVGKTPLHWAASENNTQICKILLNHTAELEAIDKRGATPLHLTLMNYPKSIDTIQCLLNHGAILQYKHIIVQTFLYFIDQSNDHFLLFISFHLFVDNRETIDTLIEHFHIPKMVTYLKKFKSIWCRINVMMNKCCDQIDNRTLSSSSSYEFPNIFKKTSKELAQIFLHDDKCRQIMKRKIDNIKFIVDFELCLEFLRKKYNNSIRILVYQLLIDQKYFKICSFNMCPLIFTQILDFVTLNDLKNVLKAFGLTPHSERYF